MKLKPLPVIKNKYYLSLTSKILVLVCFVLVNTYNVYSQDQDTTKSNNKKIFQMKKDPTTAILYSLVFPGAGQIYTEDYWKVPVFALGSGVLVFLIIDNNTKYNNYQSLYDTEYAINKTSNLTLKYKSYKEYFRDMRDQSAFYLVAVYLLSAVDAYAGAHLFDFNVSDQVKLNIQPVLTPMASKMNFQIKF